MAKEEELQVWIWVNQDNNWFSLAVVRRLRRPREGSIEEMDHDVEQLKMKEEVVIHGTFCQSTDGGIAAN